MCTSASTADATDSTAACLASIDSLIKGSVGVQEGQAEWGHFVAQLRLRERLRLVKIGDGREPPLHRRIIARQKTNSIVSVICREERSLVPNSETCDYCHKRLPANTGSLCDECEASLFCHVCGTSLKKKSWTEFYPDKFYCDPCAKKEQANLDANSLEVFTIYRLRNT
jgi:hypothetical protein